MKYRKKPVVIEAVEVKGLTPKKVQPVLDFCGDKADFRPKGKGVRNASLTIGTLEGPLGARKGDMIIKGVKGVFYPCKKDIFEQTYEMVEEIAEGTFPSPHGAEEPRRFRLPNERPGPTVKFTLTEQSDTETDENGNAIVYIIDGYFTVNKYPDGMPGEIWITINKPGSSVQGFANCWAIAMSMLLQYGVHPQKLYDKFKLREFQPNGMSGVPSVPIAKSLVDLIVRWMEANMAPTARPVNEEDMAWMQHVEEVVK